MNEQKALENVRALEARRCEIEAEFTKLLDACGSYVRADQEAASALFAAFRTNDLHNLIEVRSKVAAAQQLAYILNVQKQQGITGRQFRDENPNFRDVLRSAAECLLKKATGELDRVTDAEAKRLRPKGLEGEVLSSPEVRARRLAVEHLERLLAAITRSPDDEVWVQNAQTLLEV